jgi:hypothetical protein
MDLDANPNVEALSLGAGAETGDVTVVPETAHATASAFSPRVATHSHYPDGTEEIVIGGEGFRSSSLVAGEDLRQHFQLLGDRRPAQNEQDVLQACRSLRAALHRTGEAWGPFALSSSPADDVDAIAEDGAGAVLRVQVTQVERAVWSRLARDRQATLRRSVQELAVDIRTAVESKSKKHSSAQRSKLVLALDAIRSPGYVHDTVVAAFVSDHGAWAAHLGYRAIWLVGPTADLTRQLC